MTTSTGSIDPPARSPLRLHLDARPPASGPHGRWWPQSRDLQTEAADLVDHFPPHGGRIGRLLFSRPDWDDGVVNGSGVRRIRAARGAVKVGSFPGDDTRLMVLTMASGDRLKLSVIPSDTDPEEGRRLLRGPGTGPSAGSLPADQDRWDSESPSR